MHELTLGMNASLDGFVATPEDGLDRTFPSFSPDLMADTEKLHGGFDATEHPDGVVVRASRPRKG